MNIIKLTVFFAAILTFSLQLAEAASCVQPLAPFAEVMQQRGSSPQRDDCVCDESLRNLDVTLPKQMRLVAACGLRWNDGSKVDLSTQKASLDKYTHKFTDPFVWQAEIFITGTAKLSGPFTLDVNDVLDTEYAILAPVPPLIDKGFRGPLADSLRGLYFIDKHTFERFHASIPNSRCINANATIEIGGIHVMISEGDGAGAYPNKYKVLSMDGFKPCAEQ